MTTAEFTSLPIDAIIILERQRKALANIEELADSINRLGLMHPIVVQRNNTLIAGERRLTACKSLGWTSIPVQYSDEIDPIQLQLLELEENTKRVDLTWQEENDAISTYHKLRAETEQDWTATKTATELGISNATVSRHIAVAAARKTDPTLEQKGKMSEAVTAVTRKAERQKVAVLDELIGKESSDELLNTDFLVWLKEQKKPKYNFLHCDFPYGINFDKAPKGAAQSFGGYEDTPELYKELVQKMIAQQDKFILPDAHCIFWLSIQTLAWTTEQFKQAGWFVDPFPLIWVKSDNSGIAPDYRRRPRNVYETALFCTRGKRMIAEVVGNAFLAPNKKTIHASEKPVEMLRHFFRLTVDETTVMLDPTMGSANSLIAAKAQKAKHVTGLEINEEYFQAAVSNFKTNA